MESVERGESESCEAAGEEPDVDAEAGDEASLFRFFPIGLKENCADGGSGA